MLQRATAAACRCASTSTALPCRHSAVRSYSRSTSRTAASVQPARAEPGNASLEYGAPLWSAPSPQTRWFGPSDPPSANASALPLDDSLANRLSAYLTSRGPRTALSSFRDEFGEYLAVADRADMPLVRAMVLEDAHLAAQSNKAKNRLGLERFATKELVEGGKLQIVLAHDQNAVQQIDEVAQEREQKRAARRAPHEAEAHFPRLAEDAVGVEARSVEAESPAEGAVFENGTDAAAFLRRVLVPSTTSIAPNSLASAWDPFAATADLSDSPTDLELAVALLHHLSAPSAPDATSARNLPLALRVLQSLLEVLSDDVVAPQPAAADGVPDDARLQAVLLRTAANIAVEEDFLPLAVQSLQSLDRLVRKHAALGSTSDAELASQAAELAVEHLADQRAVTYRPSANAPDASTLATAASLFQLVSPSVPVLRNGKVRPSLPSPLSTLLSAYADEAAHRHRWDLVAQHWQLWAPRGWSLPTRWTLKLARWLAGEAPYSTYGPPPAPGQRSIRVARIDQFARFVTATTRALRLGWTSSAEGWTSEDRSEWLDLLCQSTAATPFTASLARQTARRWQTEAPPTSPFMLRAPTLLALVRTAVPPKAETAFAAEQGRELLLAHLGALVSPQSPYARADGSITHFDLTTLAQGFALLGDTDSFAQVFRRLLEQRVVPDRKDVEVVLAQAHKVAAAKGGKRASAAGQALGLVRRAAEMGIKVDVAMLQRVMHSALERVLQDLRADSQAGDPKAARLRASVARREAVDGVLQVAERMGATLAELDQLRTYADDFLPLRTIPLAPSVSGSDAIPPHRNRLPAALSPAAALQLLRQARLSANARNASLAEQVFLRATSSLDPSSSTRPGSQSTNAYDERLILLALEAILAAEDSDASTRRAALRRVIDRALAPLTAPSTAPGASGATSLIRSREGVDVVLRALVRIGEVAAIDRFVELLRRQSEATGLRRVLQPSDDARYTVVRWAVGEFGRGAVTAGHGWLGQAARDFYELGEGKMAPLTKEERKAARQKQRKKAARKKGEGEQ
ncbi:hypothetical protein Rhopal_007221-T1 [Rhodotorula paludigena]|uniref:Uncharacterized protein n=1 Tax=Rhodotorula paludigena TaxID=86838 RepID=A0AAV5GYP6_9BASI|nr:hypothetical protein Rhopal_007221-T1 [Rhodotorula paludigena]